MKFVLIRRWLTGLLIGVMLMQTGAGAFQNTPHHHTSFAQADAPACDQHKRADLGQCAACLACCVHALPNFDFLPPAHRFPIHAQFMALDETFRNYLAPGLERPPQLRAA